MQLFYVFFLFHVFVKYFQGKLQFLLAVFVYHFNTTVMMGKKIMKKAKLGFSQAAFATGMDRRIHMVLLHSEVVLLYNWLRLLWSSSLS